MSAAADEVQEVIAAIKPLMAGRNPAIQGAILADLVSLWLAGHQVDDAAIDGLIELHVDTVRELLPVNRRLIAGLRRHHAH